MIKIAPSILSCNFSRMGEELRKMEKAGADWIHVDVMDGHFVPNLTLGAPVVKCLKPITPLPLDVHLMISEPHRYIDDFADAGADIITFHTESDSNIAETIDKIKSRGIVPALSVKPKTPPEVLFPYLDRIGMVLIMTVEPGFGGQSFMSDMMPKIRAVKAEADRRGLILEIQIDGGVSRDTIGVAAQYGANVFVAGTSLFKAADPTAEIKLFREIAGQAIEKSFRPA